MVLYVLLTWLSALALVLLAELFTFSYLSQPISLAAPTHQHLAELSVASNPQAFHSVWWIFLFLVGCFIGYTLETRIKPAQWAYHRLQKSYPTWYSRWHAPRRELSLSLWLAGLVVGINLLALLVIAFTPPYFAGIPLSTGCALGLLILPALRYRKTLVEDRPEQAPQAILHKVKPTYSSDRALKIGQIYLRILLPLFMLFLSLVLPLSLQVFTLQAWQGALLLSGLVSGLFIAWKTQPESHLLIAHFRENFYQLTGLFMLSAGLLIFGIASGNPVELFFFSLWSAYLAGIY